MGRWYQVCLNGLPELRWGRLSVTPDPIMDCQKDRELVMQIILNHFFAIAEEFFHNIHSFGHFSL
jgi:hypothetical protein